MSGKRKKGSEKAAPRAYGRLARHERDTVQRMLERGASCREIARGLGRSPSTVSAEVASHRFVTAPKPRRGERVDAGTDLSAACPRLAAWPRCCNGCGRYRAVGCKRRPHVFYDARAAQLCADSVLVSSRRGIDADEPAAAARLEAIRGCLRRGLSPEQMAACNGGPVDLSPSTIYRWVAAGYDGMTNMELRRKVGYRPRKRAAGLGVHVRHGERQVRRREPVEPDSGALGQQLPYLDAVSLAGALLVAAPRVAVEQPRLARPLAEQRRDRRLVGELRAVVGEHGAEDPPHAVGAQHRAHALQRRLHARRVLRLEQERQLEPAGAVEQREQAGGVLPGPLDGVHLPGRGARVLPEGEERGI